MQKYTFQICKNMQYQICRKYVQYAKMKYTARLGAKWGYDKLTDKLGQTQVA